MEDLREYAQSEEKDEDADADNDPATPEVPPSASNACVTVPAITTTAPIVAVKYIIRPALQARMSGSKLTSTVAFGAPRPLLLTASPAPGAGM